METIAYACHTAYLDPMTGSGLLVRPNPDDDLRTAGPGGSLQEADWNRAMRDLYARGWAPTEDEDGSWALDSETPDGREVVGLYGQNSIIEKPSTEQLVAAFAELRQLAGSTPD
ncbi:hypothetical protein ACQPZX_02700 [Actinoplanes sp. CA-142083]|uniref:hypothetical protein n=1 Tax=Actinoplanes sp. CA-142083 TaxID=3239903 RepID=UPI003D925AE8